MSGVIIIGSGHAGCSTAINLRRSGYEDTIMIFSIENELPYHRPPLSKKFFKGDLALEDILIKSEAFYSDNNIQVKTNTEVKEVDVIERYLKTCSGEKYEFSYLVFATGASSRVFLDNAYPDVDISYLRNITDVNHINNLLQDSKKPLLIGGGYIGLELAASMTEMGMSVSIIEQEERLLKRVTAPVMSEFYKDLHESRGVQIFCNQSIKNINKFDHGYEVLTSDDNTIKTDFIIAGIGAIPNDDLAQKAGIKCKNGILVDQYCRTNIPYVFAAGDCANAYNELYGFSMRVESVPSANAHAKVVNSSILGNEVTNRELPWFWSDQYEFKLQMAGLSQGYDEIYLHGKITEDSFMICYGKEGSLIAVDSVNMPKNFNNYKKALANGMRLSMDLIKDPSFDPSSIFSASY
tara:strand:+ start:546 stop:1769 length:1224 start_codon:yes stop_codon:yes gene_type:complete